MTTPFYTHISAQKPGASTPPRYESLGSHDAWAKWWAENRFSFFPCGHWSRESAERFCKKRGLELLQVRHHRYWY